MKKTSKIFAVLLCVALVVGAIAVFAACDPGQTVTGDCHYDMTYGENTTRYGVKVDVTVKNGKITAVKLWSDEDSGYVRTTKTWQAKEDPLQLGFDAAEDAYDQWLKDTFVGKTVEEVNAFQAKADASGQSVTTDGVKLAGATQSSARIIVAVKDALSKLDK